MQEVKFLNEVLIDTHQSELPPVWNDTDIWVKAIAKVKLMGVIDAYCIAQRGDNGSIDIIKSYNAARITSKDKIYPYEFIDSTDNKVLNKVLNECKEQRPTDLKIAIKELEPNFDLRTLKHHNHEQLAQVLIDIKAKHKIKELNE